MNIKYYELNCGVKVTEEEIETVMNALAGTPTVTSAEFTNKIKKILREYKVVDGMKYDKQNYIGKNIQLYPGDTVKKYGKILNVDDLGWTIEIINVNSCNNTYTTGDVIFISHSKSFSYKIL